MAVVVEEKAVVVVVSFLFKPSSLFSFVLHFVAFSLSTCCGGSGADVEVVVVVADVVLVVVVVCSFPSLASSSSSLSFFGAGLFSAFAVAVASLNVLHSLRCPPFFQWCTWQSRPQYCTVCTICRVSMDATVFRVCRTWSSKEWWGWFVLLVYLTFEDVEEPAPDLELLL